MTKDELMQRVIFVPATPRKDRAAPLNVRRRGDNHVEKDAPHPSENYDSFFDYEEEFFGGPPAREMAAVDLDRSTEHVVLEPETESEDESSFIVMEKIPTQIVKANNIATTSVDTVEDSKKPAFEFIQCSFIKDDENRCKKQAKKGHKYCGIHRKFLEKQAKEEEEDGS